jgi:hypothetical protein
MVRLFNQYQGWLCQSPSKKKRMAMSIQVLVTNFVRAMDRKKKEKESCWKREGFVSINIDAALILKQEKELQELLYETKGKFSCSM